jgi:hypothetical protein
MVTADEERNPRGRGRSARSILGEYQPVLTGAGKDSTSTSLGQFVDRLRSKVELGKGC